MGRERQKDSYESGSGRIGSPSSVDVENASLAVASVARIETEPA